MTDGDGVTVSNEYAYSGQVLRTVRNGVGVDRETVYDAGGRPQEVLRNGVRSAYDYTSDFGLLSTVERIDDNGSVQDTMHYYYDAGDRLLEAELVLQSGSPVSTTFDYDLWGRSISRTNATPATWFTLRDVMGRVRLQTDPSGVSMETKYDYRGRISEKEFPGGWETRSYAANLTFNRIPNLWRMNSTVNSGVSSVYVDSLGRQRATVEPTGIVTISTWVGADLTTAATRQIAGPAMTADLNRQDFTYDTAGRLKTSVGPYFPADLVATHDKTTFNYTAAGRLLSNVAPDQTTIFSYEHGRLKSETFDDQVRTYFYNDAEAPWPTDMELSGGGSIRSTSFTRDAVGRILSETITAPGQESVVNEQSNFTVLGAPQFQQRKVDNAVETKTNWTYDVAGRPLARLVDPPGLDRLTTAWAWNPNGSLQKVTTPSNKQIAYTYSATTGLLDRVYNPVDGTDYSQVVTRNGAGQVTEYTVAPDSTTRTVSYDLAGRPLTRSTVGGGISLSWGMTYNQLGQLDSESYTNNGATVWSNTFLYNGRGRLFDEFRGATGQRFFYTWTPGGNLTRIDEQAVPGGAVTTLTTARYDSTYTQKLTTVDGATISYDAWQEIMTDQHGNVFTYTADGEVRTVKGPTGPLVEIQRDSAGMPVAYVEGGVVPRLASWHLDPGAIPLEVRQSTNVPRTYIKGVVGQVGVLNNGVFASSEQDTQGSHLREGTAVLNQATAFGASVIASTGSDERFLFAGLETVKGAAGGIHLARHRAYDSETGRFKSPDPVGLEAGNHRFLYVDGDPLGYSDVMGYTSDPIIEEGPITIEPASCLPSPAIIHFPHPFNTVGPPMTIAIDNPITPNAVMGSGSGTYAGDNHPNQYTQAEMNADSQEAYDKQHDDGGTYQPDWKIGPKIIKDAKGSGQKSGGRSTDVGYGEDSSDALADAGGSGAGQFVRDEYGNYADRYTSEIFERADLEASKEWTGWSPIPPATIDNQTEEDMAVEPSSEITFHENIDVSTYGTTVTEDIGAASAKAYNGVINEATKAGFQGGGPTAFVRYVWSNRSALMNEIIENPAEFAMLGPVAASWAAHGRRHARRPIEVSPGVWEWQKYERPPDIVDWITPMGPVKAAVTVTKIATIAKESRAAVSVARTTRAAEEVRAASETAIVAIERAHAGTQVAAKVETAMTSTTQPLHTLEVINPPTSALPGSLDALAETRRLSLTRGRIGHEMGTVGVLFTDEGMMFVGAEARGALPRVTNEALRSGMLGLRNATTRLDITRLSLPKNAFHPDYFLPRAALDVGQEPWMLIISRPPCVLCEKYLAFQVEIGWMVAPR